MSTLAGQAFQRLAFEAARRDVPEAKSTGRSMMRIDMADGTVTSDPQNFAIYSSAQAFSSTNVADETVRFTRVLAC